MSFPLLLWRDYHIPLTALYRTGLVFLFLLHSVFICFDELLV